MLTQEELVVYPSPEIMNKSLLENSSKSTASAEKLVRFPLSQILSNNQVMLIEKISGMAQENSCDGSAVKDFLLVMTSDLVIHTFELSVKSAINRNVSPEQIKLLSSHDCKNVIAASEIPKLKRVIQSSIMRH